MKTRLLLVVLPAILVGGCGEPAPEVEKAPPTEQKVVMVPAVGGGAQAQNGNTNAPTPNPNSTPDTVKQPGDK